MQTLHVPTATRTPSTSSSGSKSFQLRSKTNGKRSLQRMRSNRRNRTQSRCRRQHYAASHANAYGFQNRTLPKESARVPLRPVPQFLNLARIRTRAAGTSPWCRRQIPACGRAHNFSRISRRRAFRHLSRRLLGLGRRQEKCSFSFATVPWLLCRISIRHLIQPGWADWQPQQCK